jgi:hypothetical protein
MKSILKIIQTPATGTGHQYILHENMQKNITELFKEK